MAGLWTLVAGLAAVALAAEAVGPWLNPNMWVYTPPNNGESNGKDNGKDNAK